MSSSVVPSYKQKFPLEKYLRKGNPSHLTEVDLPAIDGWIPVNEEEKNLWEDAKEAINRKNKKREFWIEYEDSQQQMSNGKVKMEIQILHVDYRGIKFSAEDDDPTKLQARFWPTVQKLLAYFFTPRVLKRESY